MTADVRAQGDQRMAVHVRPATLSDALDILRWRNDDYARAMSRHTALIAEDTHRDWLGRVLGSQDTVLMIGEFAGVSVGMVRFDCVEVARWEVSIVLAAEARGKCISRDLLAKAMSVFFAVQCSTTLIANIKESNEPSSRLFGSLGFMLKSENGDMMEYILLPNSSVEATSENGSSEESHGTS
jgi:UDP-2,4-diacetamido-2,4,6-trideoxy-beta-L-altropyranose hydrolase